MATYLEPDILECEIKWALGSITTNKAGGGDRIPVELFQILKDDACESATLKSENLSKPGNASKSGKLSSGFIPIQKKRQCQSMFRLLNNCTHLTH